MASNGDKAFDHQLITIPISHYCEKARWALERGGIAYLERAHLQGIHRFVTRRAGGKGSMTAPVLVCPEGALTDSTDILEYVDRAGSPAGWLYPDEIADEVRALEDDFDERLGPHGRRWMYWNMFDQNELVREYGTTGVPNWERRSLPFVWWGAKRMIGRVLEVTDESALLSLRRVEETFDEIGERLSDGRSYLVGGSFTAADLTFAALSAAVLAPKGYGVPLPQPDLMPEPMATHVCRFREHPAGQFALRMYDEERAVAPAAPFV
jgi:glutathione S-transferase